MVELEQFFADLARAVPDGPADEVEFLFERGNLPVLPLEFSSQRVHFRKIGRDYNGWYRVDHLALFVDERSCRALGLFLLACAFHDPEQCEIHVGSDWSEIRKIVYRARWPVDDPPVGLVQRPATFRYFPAVTEKHPWLHESDVSNLPLLALSNESETVLTDEEWRQRDTVFIESTTVGTVRLAELLLNASCSWNKVREYELEGDAGFRGVAPMSAELRLLLPGSDHWAAHPELLRSERPKA
ncbi:MAG TPA: hypothetical protein VJT73_18775 [Polyangiaceae bacterium]|nr:hypothetical protein [Polyangiaceae bacterium]